MVAVGWRKKYPRLRGARYRAHNARVSHAALLRQRDRCNSRSEKFGQCTKAVNAAVRIEPHKQ